MHRLRVVMLVVAVLAAAVALVAPFPETRPGGAPPDPSSASGPPQPLQEDSPTADERPLVHQGPHGQQAANADAGAEPDAQEVRLLLESGRGALVDRALESIARAKTEAVIDEAIRFAMDPSRDDSLASEAALSAKATGNPYASRRLAELFRERNSSPLLRAAILAAFRFHWVSGDRELLLALREELGDAQLRARIDRVLAEKGE